jgi:hypothetical protein
MYGVWNFWLVFLWGYELEPMYEEGPCIAADGGTSGGRRVWSQPMRPTFALCAVYGSLCKKKGRESSAPLLLLSHCRSVLSKGRCIPPTCSSRRHPSDLHPRPIQACKCYCPSSLSPFHSDLGHFTLIMDLMLARWIVFWGDVPYNN